MENNMELKLEDLENVDGGAGAINYDTGKYVYHTVARGESLSLIGSRYGCTWQIIYNLNRQTIGSNPNIIQPNMVLRIPVR